MPKRGLMKSKLTSDGRKNNSELSRLKMRRSSNIMMYFRREHLIAENYMRRQTFRIDLNAMMLLSYFSNWRTASEASERLSGYTRESVFHTIQNLETAVCLSPKILVRTS